MIYIIDADDFCGDNNSLNVLYEIKKNNSDFKITLFTIPGRCSFTFINMIKKIDWINMAYHGWMHDTNRECELWDYKQCKNYLTLVEGYDLERGYKCYDENTEILTESGWKLFKDISKKEQVMTVDKNLNAKYDFPIDYFEMAYKGKMILFGNANGIKISVTPDHRMLVKNRCKNKIHENICIAAEKTNSSHNILRKIEWIGNTINQVEINGKDKIVIDIDTFLIFAGLYLSEGCSNGNRVSIFQNDPMEIYKKIEKMPFNKYIKGNAVRINSKQLCDFMINEFGKLQPQRKIPIWIKNLPKEKINILLDELIYGDGSVRKENKAKRYYTTSPRLADDVQELFMKVGSIANIRIRRTKGNKVDVGNGRIYYQNYDQYVVDEVVGRMESCIRISGKYKNKLEYDYDGYIYCVTVPSGYIIVRNQNTKRPIICGNSPGWIIPDGMYQALLERNYWVADQTYNNERRPKELRAYLLDQPGRLHYHIGNLGGINKNEISLYMDFLSNLKGEFKFIKDVVQR